MKKILLFASVVAAMASCAKTEVSEVNPTSPDLITITTGVSSKAGDTVASTITTQDAETKLYANDVDDDFGSFFTDILKGNGSTLSTTGTYYWPSTGSLDFYAYYPASLGDATSGVVPVTIASSAASQIDIVAAKTEDAVKGSTGVVELDLKHMLSRVDFQFNIGKGIIFKLKSFKLNGVAGTTDGLDLAANAMKEATDATASYTYANSSADFTSVYTTGDTETTATVDLTLSSLVTDAGKFMLLPQTLVPSVVTAADTETSTKRKMTIDSGANIEIEYSMSYDNGDSYIVGGASTYTKAYIPMPATELVAGNSYLYTLDISEGNFNGGYDDTKGEELIDASSTISFTVTVSGWSNSDDTTTTPIAAK